MTASRLSIPWQYTGNHWLALPCIHPADGAVHAVGLLHRGARAALEFAGGADFLEGTAPALLRPVLQVDGAPLALADGAMAWERALQWLPTFTATHGDVVVRGTVFAPFGRDADTAGAVYALAVENRGPEARRVAVGLEGVLGHRQLRVRTARACEDASRVLRMDEAVILDGSASPGLGALAILAEGEAELHVVEAAGSASWRLGRTVEVPAGGRVEAAFHIAAGPERDGALATARVLRRRGWRMLLGATREALQGLEQVTGMESLDGLINRNLLFAYFYGVGRGLDDAQYYLVRSRAPWHPLGVTIRDWEALAWTIPAVQLADGPLARELLLRTCEVHGYAPGQGVHYLDGTLFEPGFTLEGCAAYPIAADRYIRDTSDDRIVEEPVLADTLYLVHDDLAARRDREHPLYHTDVTLGGLAAPQPFTLHANAVVAMALDALKRTLAEEDAREVQDPAAVRAAVRRHFVGGGEGKGTFAAAADLAGARTSDDLPEGSVGWLPFFEAVERTDSTYRRSMKRLSGEPSGLLVQQLGRLLGPDASVVLEWLRRAPLGQGVAATEVDADGRAVAGEGDAALAGLLAYVTWFTVHAHGLRP